MHIDPKPTPTAGASPNRVSAASSGLNCAPNLPCQDLVYHTGFLGLSPGAVMHQVNAYLIFWMPSGSTAPSPQYERLIERFFYDAGTTPYFNLLGQYCDNSACPPSGMTLAGVFNDTTDAYPHAGTTSDPLQDSDIQHEVDNAISDNSGWGASDSNIYMVYTAPGINSCMNSNSCTYPTAHTYCAYHGHYNQGFLGSGAKVIYANMPYDDSFGCDISGTVSGGPQDGQSLNASPNNDLAADSEISVSSHELFESITDYDGDAWYADDSNGDEIGDPCNFYLGSTIRSDGSNVTLNGDRFAVQEEWSNSGHGCSLPQSTGDALAAEPATATFSAGTAATSGCTQNVLSANDDGSTGAVGLPFPVNFFGTTYNQLYVNNNGNVTFNGPLSTFTPFGLTSTSIPIIAPFFADVDTRGPASGVVTYGGEPATGGTSGYFCVNWVNVGYYGAHDDKLDSFQLVLVDESALTGHPGDFDITFNYRTINWETGDASGGIGGLGGSSARAGYSNGSTQALELDGSGVNGSLLDGGPNSLAANSLNSLQAGRYFFQVRNGVTPTGGTISGTVDDSAMPPNPVSGALVQVCGSTSGATVCTLTTTGATGAYAAVALAAGSYQIAVNPPPGSPLFAQTDGPVTLGDNGAVVVNITLTGPQPLPGGTVIGTGTNPGGTPVLYWQTTTPLTTTGCPNGSASFAVTASNSQTDQTGTVSATLTESPPGSGHYSGMIPALYPLHGAGTVTITITCPNPSQNTTVTFSIYIDPSGQVVDTAGHPIAGATVTLLSADSEAGPFVPVPDGSAVMSPGNRHNPDTTSSQGTFGWDVLSGWYMVQASMPGCTAPSAPSQTVVDSAAFQVPPEVLNLRLVLQCSGDSDLTLSRVPSEITVTATGPGQATVNYVPPTAVDSDNDATVSCDTPPGSTFPLGSTTVTCTATDVDDTNSPAAARFLVTVVPGPLDHLVLSPASATVTAGHAQTYTARGADQFGNDRGDLTSVTTFTVDHGSCNQAACTAPPGVHTVTGTAGTPPVTGTATLTVMKEGTVVTVTTAPAHPVFGQPLTFTATVTPADPDPLVPTGTVSFTIDSAASPQVTVALNATKAVFSIAVLGAGVHHVVATYNGDSNFTASRSSPVSTAAVTCSTMVTGTHAGSITVAAGTACIVGANVTGAVVVSAGASVDIEGSTVGAITATAGATLRVCASHVTGAVSITNASAFVLVGDAGDDTCGPNTIGGALILSRDTHGVESIDNKVTGTVTATGNSGTGPFPEDSAPQITGNRP